MKADGVLTAGKGKAALTPTDLTTVRAYATQDALFGAMLAGVQLGRQRLEAVQAERDALVAELAEVKNDLAAALSLIRTCSQRALNRIEQGPPG